MSAAVLLATCAGCGVPKFLKCPCPMCGCVENVDGSVRSVKR